MTDVDGNEKKLSDFRGKLIYIDLWATWCGPCIQESPAFTALSEKYPDIEFLQISRDEQKEAWESYIAHKNSPLTQYQARGTFAMKFERYEEVPAQIAQKIIDAYAPRPSSTEIITLLDSLSKA